MAVGDVRCVVDMSAGKGAASRLGPCETRPSGQRMDGYHEAKRVREDKRLEGIVCDGPGLPVRGRDRGPCEDLPRNPGAKHGEWRHPDREKVLHCARGIPSAMAGVVGEIGPLCDAISPYARQQQGRARVWMPTRRRRAKRWCCVVYSVVYALSASTMAGLQMACPEQAQLLHRPAVPCFVLELAVPRPAASPLEPGGAGRPRECNAVLRLGFGRRVTCPNEAEASQ
jgi:hypothetical protein